MKKKGLIILLATVFVFGLFWLFRHKPANPIEKTDAEPTLMAGMTNPLNEAKQHASIAPQSSNTVTEAEDFFAQREKEMKQAEDRANNEWRAPIEFYGRVVDETGNPIEDAKVAFGWNNLSGSLSREGQSDSQGLFSLQGEQGKFLSVKVSKKGFYEYKPQGEGFFYAGRNENFVPDANNPIVFRLHKKGNAEPLIVFGKTIPISISGKPLELNLKTGQITTVGQGDLLLEFVRTPLAQTTNRHVFDWSLRITPRNGELVAANREFDFVAPETGYQAAELIDMPVSLPEKWIGRLDRQYFLKFTDGKYARVHIDLMPYNGSLKIESFLNPSGSRNLEYDPAVQPKPAIYE